MIESRKFGYGEEDVGMKYSFTFVAVVAVSLMSVSTAYAEEQWLCQAEAASGFGKNEDGEWQAARFTTERKLVIKNASAEDIAQVVELVDKQGASLPFGALPATVIMEGEVQLPIASCPMELTADANLLCKGPWGWTTLYFSSKTGRYLYVSPVGIWDVEDGDTDHPWADKSPFTEIGTCKKY